MTELLRSSLVAMCAATGLVTLLWLLLSLVLLPLRRKRAGPALVLLPVSGEAQGLEYHLRELLENRREYGRFRQILIVDCGLTENAVKLTCLLCSQEEDVSFCPLPALEERLQMYKDG